MKHFYLLFFLIFSCFLNGQVINFPDPNFKAKLLEPEVAYIFSLGWVSADTNSDGEIDMSEAASVFALNVSDGNIGDLTGISNFVNMKALWCENNSLTTLTIDPSIEMWDLNASHNQLTSINVHFVTGEQEFDPAIDLSYNDLTSFSLSNCVVWFGLNLTHNQLTSLNINNCGLGGFFVGYNNLTAINFSGTNSISDTADFTNNHFSVLDLAGAAVHYECQVYLGNNIEDRVQNLFNGDIHYTSNNTFLDLGDYNAMTSCEPEYGGRVYISDSPNLLSVNFMNGFNHMFITCDEGGDIFQNPSIRLEISNCPNLSNICTDEPEEDTFQFWLDLFGLQNQVQINGNCDLFLGTQELALEQFAVFPVPAKNELRIQSLNNLSIRNVEIYNNLGQIVQTEIGNQQSIDVSTLHPGVYYLNIKSGESTFIKRFIKE